MELNIVCDPNNSWLDEEVKVKVMGAIEHYKSLGAEVKSIKLPHTKYAVAVYYLVATAEASSNLARFDGVQYGIRETADNIYKMYQKTRQKGFGDEVKRRIILGTFALSSGYYDAYYLKAQKVRTLFKQDYEKAFKEVDLIISPTSPTTAFKIGEKVNDPVAMYLEDIFTSPANMTGLPAMSVPSGTVSVEGKDLPLGIQLIAPHQREDLLFKVGKEFLGEE